MNILSFLKNKKLTQLKDYYILSIKYWLQGDSWADATALARYLVYK